MTPCPKNQKFLAWLAADALDAPRSCELRAHLETCAGCRDYFSDISRLTQRLTTNPATPDIQTSEVFHRRVLRALPTAGAGDSYPVSILRRVRTFGWDWRVALSAAAVTAIALFLRLPNSRHDIKVVTVTHPSAQAIPKPDSQINLEPTLANYQMMANRSPEALDELLTRQANISLPAAPIYTASSLSVLGDLK